MENKNIKNENDLTDQNISSSQAKKENIFKKIGKGFVFLWNYFTTYEKIWLVLLWSAGIALSIIFPDIEGVPENLTNLVIVFSIITLMGGCTCELLLSKQSKWAFIVSFIFYDLTFTTVCLICGRYVTALIEFVFWMPMLFISFFSWEKRQDKQEKEKVVVKKFDFKKEIAIFIGILAASIGLGFLFTYIEGMTDMWYLDALAATFNVCNGLFLWLRYREQWIAWYGVIICETIFYILSHNWALLILEVGYLTNTTYGFFKWNIYIKKHKNEAILKTDSEEDVLKLSNQTKIKKDEE